MTFTTRIENPELVTDRTQARAIFDMYGGSIRCGRMKTLKVKNGNGRPKFIERVCVSLVDINTFFGVPGTQPRPYLEWEEARRYKILGPVNLKPFQQKKQKKQKKAA